jgi:protein SCO1/2
MKVPRFVQFGLLAAVVFVAGAGIAIWQKKHTFDQMTAAQHAAQLETSAVPEAKLSMDATPPVQAPVNPAPDTSAVAQAMPTAEIGKVIPNAPDMPTPPAAAAAPLEMAQPVTPPATPPVADAVAGVQVGGPFALIDQNGIAVTEKSWPGKYKLVFFGFTHCPDVCPATLQKISAVMDNYDPAGAKLQPLFVTTDPASDTQDVMATYMSGYPHTLGLTGSKEQIEVAEKAYKVYASPGENGAIDHSALIYLMSPDDEMMEVLDSKLSAEEMIARIKGVLETKTP